MVRTLHVIDKDLASSKARQTLRLTAGLRELGYETAVCGLSPNESEKDKLRNLFGAQAISFCHQPSRFDLTFVPRFRRTLNRLQPDVIHYTGSANAPLWFASQISGRPVVANLMSDSFGRLGTRWLNKPWFGRQAVEFVSDYPTAWSDHVVAPGVGALPNEPSMSQSLREALEVDADAKIIAVKSDLLRSNGGKDLIWALDCLRVLHPQCFLVFFGDGRDEAELRDYAARAITGSDAVRFVTPGKAADTWLQQCNCYWHADSHANLNSMLEAMRCDLPVVAIDVDETRSFLTEGENGFLVAKGDSAEFARRTNILFEDSQLSEKVRANAKQKLKTAYTIEQMARRYLSIYTKQREWAPITSKVA